MSQQQKQPENQMNANNNGDNPEPINIEKLMNHSVGISDCYYRATENEMLEDYLKAIDFLTINDNKLLKRILLN